MAFDSEERKSDFDAWAEQVSYAEEQEQKRQEKQLLKEQKKAQKEAEKAAKKAAKKGSKEDESGVENAENAENNTETAVESAENIAEAENTGAADASEVEEIKDDKHDKDYIKEKKKVDPSDINIVKELFSLIIYIGAVIILCYLIITYVGQRTTVNGRSMENTLHDGDNLWIDKFTYHFKEPERFDIIVFPYEDDVYYIKRIIGLPGETVQILADGTILINGKRLVESYGKEVIAESGTAAEERTLEEDEYFVLGDNRNDSRDSRWADVGDIEKSDIIGKAVFRLSPFKKFGKLDK